ncbi:MAG: CPBP family intramembrane metalloprotease [Gallionella sp.]|nr:CPBP family intramembrane metalloprotease [Gallionella sp.]
MNVQDMSLKQRLLLIAAVEILYMVGTRVAIHYLSAESFAAELSRTALRIATALVYWQLMKPVILSKTPAFDTARVAPLIAGLLLFFSIPVLVGNYALNTSLASLFAVTSVAVAIKEEFLFRGIMQNLLQKRFGAMRAILYTSIIFTAWHIGTWDPSVWTFGHIFLASLILGLVYVRTGSIVAVIALHTLYDAVFSFTPLMGTPLDQNWGFAPLTLAVAAMYYWAQADNLKNGATSA